MAQKSVRPKFKKLDSKIEKILSASEVAVLLENINDNIKMVAEGHFDLDRKIDNLAADTNLIKEDMHSSFISISNYVSHIEAEISEIKSDIKKIIEGKTDKKETVAIERRVVKLELELGECKKMIAVAKNS